MAPVVNQVQFSPFEFRSALLQDCERRGIALEAYSPLGTGRHLDDAEVGRIAERLGRTPAQVLIRWAVQRGVIVLPKSTHRERIEQNAAVFDFELRTRTWPRWTRSTGPVAPGGPLNTPGGDRRSGHHGRVAVVAGTCGLTGSLEHVG